MWWYTLTHGRGGEAETGEWSGYPVPFTLPRNMVYPALLPLMYTTRLSVVDWTDAPADLNGLVRFAERRNLVSARVPSHFNWPIPIEQGKWRVIDSAWTWHPRSKSTLICPVRIAVTRLKLPRHYSFARKTWKYICESTRFTGCLGWVFFFIFVKKSSNLWRYSTLKIGRDNYCKST